MGIHTALEERSTPPDPGRIRLVALDIDGTLLTPEGHVSARTAAAVRAALDRGVMVVLCTGRAYALGVQRLASELGLSLPAIVRNGTAIQDTRTGAVLKHYGVPAAAAHRALDVMLGLDLVPIVEEGPQHGDGLYTLPADQCNAAVLYYAQTWQRTHHLRHLSNSRELYQVRDINWIGGCGSREATLRAHEALSQLQGIDSAWYGLWQPDDALHCTGIAPSGCSKASTLARFAKDHGVDLSETLAIGDYLNDVEMLKEVGWGVAMGHAPDALKEVADAITVDNEHDGAALAIERYVLGGRSGSTLDGG